MFNSEGLFQIYKNVFNLVNYQLVDHSERTAYLVLKMYQKQNKHTEKEIAQFCMFALLHDIGAFKTEKIDSISGMNQLKQFEFQNTSPHAVFGYLFLKFFFVNFGLEDAVLYHHIPYHQLCKMPCKNRGLASSIFLAERFDLLNVYFGKEIAIKNLRNYKGTVFSPEGVEILEQVLLDSEAYENLSGSYTKELFSWFQKISFSEDEKISFLKPIVFSIDFRSPVTATHTIGVMHFGVEIGKRMNLTDGELKKIYIAGLVHDLGKIITPINILEKPGKLTPYERIIMEEHVQVTEKILVGNIEDEVMQIAVRHHEKMDGTGYHKGLKESDLTLSEKILMVADIASALLNKRSYKDALPVETVNQILWKEAENGKISMEVVKVFLTYCDKIVSTVSEKSIQHTEKYKTIMSDYHKYIKNIEIGESVSYERKK